MSESVKAEVVDGELETTGNGLSRKDVVEEQITRIRDDLYQKAAINQLAIIDWARVRETDLEPPKDWVEQFGIEKAQEMLVVAQAAHKPTKEAPVGLKMTQELFRGLEQARATDRLARSPNTVLVLVGDAPPPLPSMPAPKSEQG